MASDDTASNLAMVLHLSIGTRVMLRENLHVPFGLVNGALGTVHAIQFRGQFPHVIMVEFDRYQGDQRPGMQRVNNRMIVPIFKSTRQYMMGRQQCERTQFPLALAFAVTVHKSQGATFDKVVLDISDQEFTPGLNYVALSRATALNNVMFEESFGFAAVHRNTAGRSVTDRTADYNRCTQWLMQSN